MDAIFCALEQLDTEDVLQLLHGAGEGRLGQVQLFGSGGKRAALVDGGQLLQQIGVDHVLISNVYV